MVSGVIIGQFQVDAAIWTGPGNNVNFLAYLPMLIFYDFKVRNIVPRVYLRPPSSKLFFYRKFLISLKKSHPNCKKFQKSQESCIIFEDVVICMEITKIRGLCKNSRIHIINVYVYNID